MGLMDSVVVGKIFEPYWEPFAEEDESFHRGLNSRLGFLFCIRNPFECVWKFCVVCIRNFSKFSLLPHLKICINMWSIGFFFKRANSNIKSFNAWFGSLCSIWGTQTDCLETWIKINFAFSFPKSLGSSKHHLFIHCF